MKFSCARVAAIAFVTIFWAGGTAAAQPAGFGDDQHVNVTVQSVKWRGKTLGYYCSDFNNDGRIDILVTYQTPLPVSRLLPAWFPPHADSPALGTERRADIFWNTTEGFHATERTTFIIPKRARSFTIADILAQEGREIIIFDDRGALACTPQYKDAAMHGPARFKRIVNTTPFFDFPSEDDLPDCSLVVRGSGAAADSIVTPTGSGYCILRAAGEAGGAAVAEEFHLNCNVAAESSSNRFFAVSKTIPRPFLADVDGDGMTDLFVCDPSGAPQMIVYTGRKGGRFSREPAIVPSPTLRREIKGDSVFYETAEVADLNKDGVADFVVSRTEGNIGLWDTLTTSQLIYYGRKGSAGFDPKPDQVISSAGVSIVPRVIDFDGDGFLDLLVSSYRTDLLSNIKNAVLNSARVSYFLFIMEDGKYSRNPTVTRDVDLDFKVLERGGVEARAYFDGDFDGDGVKDLLAIEESAKIRAYKGTRTSSSFFTKGTYEFSSTPMLEIALRAGNDISILDLDHDGRFEIVIPGSQAIHVVHARTGDGK